MEIGDDLEQSVMDLCTVVCYLLSQGEGASLYVSASSGPQGHFPARASVCVRACVPSCMRTCVHVCGQTLGKEFLKHFVSL